MFDISLSWNLALIVTIALTMSAAFIIGKDHIISIIIATYISAIAVHGIIIMSKMILAMNAKESLTKMGIPMTETSIAFTALLLFGITLVLMIMKSGVIIEYDKDHGTIVGIIVTGMLGLSLGLLIVSTLIQFTLPLTLAPETHELLKGPLKAIIPLSPLIKHITEYTALYTSIPALLILLGSWL